MICVHKTDVEGFQSQNKAWNLDGAKALVLQIEETPEGRRISFVKEPLEFVDFIVNGVEN